MNIRKIVKRTVLVLACLVAGLALFLIAGTVISNWLVSTPPFTDKAGKVLPNSVASLETVVLGGVKQTVLIRGRSLDNPVLLYLHGGPGSSELPLMRHFNSVLEDHYIVVLWDQRGAGKSYSPFLDPSTLTIDQLLSDTHELIELLRTRFHKKKIYLVGHSFGSVLGLAAAHQYPGLLYAYIGIGQAVDFPEGERLSLRYTLEKAREAKNAEAVKELEALKDYPTLNYHWMRDVFTERKWLGEYGGVMYGKKGMQDLFFVERPPEFTPFDFVPFVLGSMRSLRSLWPQVLEYGDFRKLAPELKVPVYFVTGRHDYNVPFALVEDYFLKLKAPRKAMVWFEHSGHMPNYEEPDKFNDFMINRVLPETWPASERGGRAGEAR